jgi:hypothetical protein
MRKKSNEPSILDASDSELNALEAILDDIPDPTPTGRITLVRPSPSIWQLRLARLVGSKRKDYTFKVVIHQQPGIGGDGSETWLSVGYRNQEVELVESFCKSYFKDAGFDVDTITYGKPVTEVGKVTFRLSVAISAKV